MLIGTVVLVVCQCCVNYVSKAIAPLPLNYWKLMAASVVSGVGCWLIYGLKLNSLFFYSFCGIGMILCQTAAMWFHFPSEFQDLNFTLRTFLKMDCYQKKTD